MHDDEDNEPLHPNSGKLGRRNNSGNINHTVINMTPDSTREK